MTMRILNGISVRKLMIIPIPLRLVLFYHVFMSHRYAIREISVNIIV